MFYLEMKDFNKFLILLTINNKNIFAQVRPFLMRVNLGELYYLANRPKQ